MLKNRRSFSIMYASCAWKPLSAKKLAIISAEPSVKADANFAGACGRGKECQRMFTAKSNPTGETLMRACRM